MKTIEIGAQESAEALKLAFAEALANAINWTPDESGNVKKSGVPLYFVFGTNGNYVTLRMSNDITTVTASNNDVVFSTGKLGYKMYVVQSPAGTIAVGITDRDVAAKYPLILAQNEAGEYVGVALYSGYGCDLLYSLENSYKRMNMPQVIVDSLVCVSLDKMPDIWRVSKFKDLYVVFSSPYVNSAATYTIAGKNYRLANFNGTSNYAVIAIPET